MSQHSKPLYYSDYLQLDTLLNTQVPESGQHGPAAHDEMLFIITHQTYELWFKQILHELLSVLELFSKTPLDEKRLHIISVRLDRIIRIQAVINQQIGIIETMTPLDFLDFRNYLIPASGFQSRQFREIELRLGLSHHFSNASFGRFNPEDSAYLERIAKQPSLFEWVDAWLARTPFLECEGFSFWACYRRAVDQMLASDADIIRNNPLLSDQEKQQQFTEHESTRQSFDCLFEQRLYEQYRQQGRFQLSHKATLAALFIQLYRDEPLLQLPFRVLSRLMDIDEHLTHWRSSHALMAQRMLGSKIGTGGSSGHDYLKATVSAKRIFADLFNLSTFLIPRSLLPALPNSLLRDLGFQQDRH
ncbi:tryptophan 2,3-dioxygenase family protein [Methylomicrobium lacus]|uniref:tryptophan 2,3-dioxygenase family protein n=1 Tax=Methylomicrobium lacus TaxID=136992 RepID=UPI0035A8B2CB